MNDAFYEQFVTRKTKPSDILIRILVILFIVAVAIFGMPFIGFFSFFIAVILAMVAYYFIFPRLNVEYEYSLLNYDLDIAAIYSKEKRKHLFSIDLRQAEIMAPKNSPRLRSYHPGKTRDFSSGDPGAAIYALMLPAEQNTTCILLEPDQQMAEHIKAWMGMKLYQD